jgi:uncharacterized membrane protein
VSKHSKQLRWQNRQAQQIPNTSGFQITATAASFSGPLPPPEILVKYNDAIPGGAERILVMAEKQSQHRQNIEKAVIEANCKAQRIGPIFGFIVCMTAILGGIYLIRLGKSTEGLVAIISAVGSLATVFVFGKHKQKKELDDKAKDLIPIQKT